MIDLRKWVDFTPAARQDNPVKLGHWARVTDDDPDASGETASGRRLIFSRLLWKI